MPLAPPPRDANGQVVPHDHNGIGNQDGVIRRISDFHLADGPNGTLIVSSMALEPSTDPSGGVSIDIEGSVLAAGLDLVQHITSPQFLGSVRFITGDLRSEDLLVGFDPIPDNDHHGEIWGHLPRGKRKRLLKKARWFVPIPNVALPV